MHHHEPRLTEVIVAIGTGDNSVPPAGSLAAGIKAAGPDLLGAARLGADGHQIFVRTQLGYCAIKSYLRDLVAPLIIAKAGPTDAEVNVASCCMTDIDCGGGLKCTSAEDPCPGGKVTDPWIGQQSGPLATSEVRLVEALAGLVGRLAGEAHADRKVVTNAMAALRKAHEHRQLLFAIEEDAPGSWYDWILRLSNGTSLQVTLSTNPRRSPPVFTEDGFRSGAAERSSRISVVATDTGERLLLPRMFVGD